MQLDTERLMSDLWQRISPQLAAATSGELPELVKSVTYSVGKAYVAHVAARNPQNDAELDAAHDEFWEFLDRTMI